MLIRMLVGLVDTCRRHALAVLFASILVAVFARARVDPNRQASGARIDGQSQDGTGSGPALVKRQSLTVAIRHSGPRSGR